MGIIKRVLKKLPVWFMVYLVTMSIIKLIYGGDIWDVVTVIIGAILGYIINKYT